MFEGIITAIVTPFRDGEIDEEALRNHIAEQMRAGVHGIVPCGTTGESPTLTKEEKKRVIAITLDEVGGRMYVIAGTGTNNTRESVEFTAWARDAGADGALVITPYYNKPTQRGLHEHFKAVASVDIPIVLYNVPSRTNVSIDPGTLEELSEINNIVAIKEATGSTDLGRDFLRATNGRVTLLSGDDETFLKLLMIGAKGCISVASNIVPEKMVALYNNFERNDVPTAQRINDELMPLLKGLFIETNPIPIKQALALLGKISPELRLPLCMMQRDNIKRLKEILIQTGLLN